MSMADDFNNKIALELQAKGRHVNPNKCTHPSPYAYNEIKTIRFGFFKKRFEYTFYVFCGFCGNKESITKEQYGLALLEGRVPQGF